MMTIGSINKHNRDNALLLLLLIGSTPILSNNTKTLGVMMIIQFPHEFDPNIKHPHSTKPWWFSREFPHHWDREMVVLNIRGMGFYNCIYSG